MKIDIDRFKLLLDYSLDGKNNVNAEDLIMICKLYLESDKEEIVKELEKKCKELLLSTELSKPDLIKKLANADDPLSILMTRLASDMTSNSAELSEELPKAVLRGLVSLKDDHLVWEGKWADSMENFKLGQKNRFKYTFESTYSGDSAKIVPVSGKLEGSFMMGNDKATGGLLKVKETKFVLSFAPETDEKFMKISGNGENQFGAFDVVGRYNVDEKKLALEKSYKDKTLFDTDSEAEDAEFSDENALSEEDEDDDIDDDVGGEAELAALLEEATVPISELKKNLHTEQVTSSSSSSKRKTEANIADESITKKPKE